MKKTLIVLMSVVVTIGAFGQGQVVFNNRLTTGGPAGSLNEPLYAPIFGINPGNPTQQLQGQPNAATVGGNPLPSLGTTDYSGRALLSGTGFTAQLFYGAVGTAEGSLVLAGTATSTFRTGTTTIGAFNGTTAALNNPAAMLPGGPGTRAVFQVRAWANTAGDGAVSDWAEVLGNDAIPRGYSTMFSPNFDLGGNGSTPPNLIGISSFGLFTPVPEPSLIALGALGLGALLLRRRK